MNGLSDDSTPNLDRERDNRPRSARRRVWLLLAVVVVAALLRGWAVLQLPLDFDEPTYLTAAGDYARLLSRGNLSGVIDYLGNREHPALVKLLYGLELLALGPDVGLAAGLYAARLLSAVFGTVAALLLALLDPLAGGLLAAHTLSVKYTSQAYLEALPHLASLGAVLAMVRSARARDGWFWLSAVGLGMTAAAKFTYLPVVVVVLYLAVFEKRMRWPHLLLYALVAGAVFFALNPMLWRDPPGRLADQLFFHLRYSQGAEVDVADYPWYQPLVWLSRSMPGTWHPAVFFYPAVDLLVFILALPGLYWAWRERRWVVVWIAAGLLFLLLWPTKWPQYTLVIVPPLCLAASLAVRHFYRWLRSEDMAWKLVTELFPAPSRSFWILSGAVVVIVAVIYTIASLQQTVGRLSWTEMTTDGTLLPSSTVYRVMPGPGDQMVFGTERGAVLWSPPPASDVPDRWQVLTSANSELPHDRVLALALGADGRVWFGTEAGLAAFDGSAWQVAHAAELGLSQDKVQDLAVSSDGRLWAATPSGAAVFDGRSWTALTAAGSGLGDDNVLAVAAAPRPGGDWLYFGTAAGISRLDTASGEWLELDIPRLGGRGVSELFVDSDGRVWAGTLGSGLGVWDGRSWQWFSAGSGGLPHNIVTAIAEVSPGVFWIGTALPNQAGGALSEFDGTTWRSYNKRNSGFYDAEPLSISSDERGWRWIGTRTRGISLYRGSSAQPTARP